jgi:hypothetical protein
MRFRNRRDRGDCQILRRALPEHCEVLGLDIVGREADSVVGAGDDRGVLGAFGLVRGIMLLALLVGRAGQAGRVANIELARRDTSGILTVEVELPSPESIVLSARHVSPP